MFLIVLTFVLTTSIYGILIWLACRRVLQRIQGDPAAVKAITEFVLIPLLGRSPDNGEVPPGAAETPSAAGGPDGSPYGGAPPNGQTASGRGNHETFR